MDLKINKLKTNADFIIGGNFHISKMILEHHPRLPMRVYGQLQLKLHIYNRKKNQINFLIYASRKFGNLVARGNLHFI